MRYSDAIELARAKSYLIGRTINRATIDEIIICPTRPDLLKIFQEKYREGTPANELTASFRDEDLQVAVIIGKKYLREECEIEWKTIDWAENNMDTE